MGGIHRSLFLDVRVRLLLLGVPGKLPVVHLPRTGPQLQAQAYRMLAGRVVPAHAVPGGERIRNQEGFGRVGILLP